MVQLKNMRISTDVQAVVYTRENSEIQYLLLERFDAEKGENNYRLVKGGVEKDEPSNAAILREINEETGLSDLKIISTIQSYSYTVGDIIHNVEVFLVQSSGKETIANSNNEGDFLIRQIIWCDKEKAESLLNFDQEKQSILLSENFLNNKED